MGNQEWTIQTLTTLGTQDTGCRQKHKKAKKMGNMDTTQNPGMNPGAHDG